MAMADYRLCDLCGCKVFYDANLNYENEPSEYIRGDTYSLENLGDWAVICRECAKVHEVIIVEISNKGSLVK